MYVKIAVNAHVYSGLYNYTPGIGTLCPLRLSSSEAFPPIRANDYII